MRFFVRSLALLSALSIVSIAHAETFSGLASFTDTSSAHNNVYNFTGTFANPNFSFDGVAGTVYTDALTIDTNFTSGGFASNDNLSVAVNFTLPSSTSGGFGGTGTFYFLGILAGSDIDWTSNTQTVTFSDGSSVQLSLPNFDYGLSIFGPFGSQTENLTVTVLSAATPEPSSLMLLGTGVLGLAGIVRRKLTA